MLFRHAYFTLLGLLLFGGCENPVPPPQTPATSAAAETLRTYSVTGVVQKLDPDGKTVVIKHEAIPNYMVAMTMPFEVRNTNDLKTVQPGDQVTFKMLVGTNDAWIENIQKFGSTNIDAPPEHQSVRVVREVEPLSVGDVMTDYTFTNELGKTIRLSDFKGQALAFTFFFTRCPFPTFCPRMSSHFADASRQLLSNPNAPTNWHLLNISFDPENDTPARMKVYASLYKYDPARWNFVTGAIIDIDAITEQFGLAYVYREGTFDHKLRTVVVDANFKVQQIFFGNEWKPEQLVEEIIKAAKVERPAP